MKTFPDGTKEEIFLKKIKNITLHKGNSKDGDLFDISNLDYCYDNFKNKIDFITADGGFDFSTDYNKQELFSTKLIIAQMLYALVMQKENGIFILKIFDCYSSAVIDVIYILSSFYKEVYVCKPNTSRYANSEKYIVCKNFKYLNTQFLFEKFKSILQEIKKEKFVKRIIDNNISISFKNKLDDINTIFGQQQIQFIINTIDMIRKKDKNDKIEAIKKKNIKKSIDWCVKNNIDYNNIDLHQNIFLKSHN